MCDAAEVVRDRMVFWSALAGDQEPAVPGGGRADADPGAGGRAPSWPRRWTPCSATSSGTRRRAPRSRSSISRRDGWVAVRVDDAGPGIDDPERAMRRGESDQGSTGLGLDIVRRAAEAAGGSVSMDRAALGGASVVMLLADAEAPPKQASRFGLVGRLARERDPNRRRWPRQRTN